MEKIFDRGETERGICVRDLNCKTGTYQAGKDTSRWFRRKCIAEIYAASILFRSPFLSLACKMWVGPKKRWAASKEHVSVCVRMCRRICHLSLAQTLCFFRPRMHLTFFSYVKSRRTKSIYISSWLNKNQYSKRHVSPPRRQTCSSKKTPN